MFSYGINSIAHLAKCHAEIILIMNHAIKESQVDFGISCGYRPPQVQFELFKKGRELIGNHWIKTGAPIVTNIDGIKKKGKHNFLPSKAVDVFAHVPGRRDLTYNPNYLIYIGGVITSTAARLKINDLIMHDLRWGYNWDGDGQIGTDQKFMDLPHFELV